MTPSRAEECKSAIDYLLGLMREGKVTYEYVTCFFPFPLFYYTLWFTTTTIVLDVLARPRPVLIIKSDSWSLWPWATQYHSQSHLKEERPLWNFQCREPSTAFYIKLTGLTSSCTCSQEEFTSRTTMSENLDGENSFKELPFRCSLWRRSCTIMHGSTSFYIDIGMFLKSYYPSLLSLSVISIVNNQNWLSL